MFLNLCQSRVLFLNRRCHPIDALLEITEVSEDCAKAAFAHLGEFEDLSAAPSLVRFYT